MNIKRIIALTVATVMAFGSTVTVFAENSATDATGTLSANGAGSNEGYLDETIVKVMLPVTTENTFKFTMDPQRLVAATDAAKYGEATFTDDATSNGVYFLADTNKYDSTSPTIYFANESTYDVALTVKYKVTAADSDPVTLATTNDVTVESGTTPKLYIGAIVGDGADAVALSTSEGTVVKNIAAIGDNFEITYANSSYTFSAKEDSFWNAIPIKFEGKVTEIAADKEYKAPTINLTYSWAKANTAAEGYAKATDTVLYDGTTVSGGSAAPTLSRTTISTSNKTVTVTGGTVSALVLNKTDGSTTTLTSSHYTYSSSTGVITFKSDSMISNNAGATITISYSDYNGTSTLTIQ